MAKQEKNRFQVTAEKQQLVQPEVVNKVDLDELIEHLKNQPHYEKFGLKENQAKEIIYDEVMHQISQGQVKTGRTGKGLENYIISQLV